MLNQNSTVVTALATAALVVVTAIYAYLVWQTLREMRRQDRPYVFVDVLKRGKLLEAVIRNTGQRGAKNIRLHVYKDVSLGDSRCVPGWPLFQKPIPFLPPGQSLAQLVGYEASDKVDRDKMVLDYRLSYLDGNQKYEQRFTHDLSSLFPVGGDPFPLAGDHRAVALGSISESMKAMVSTLDEIRRTMK